MQYSIVIPIYNEIDNIKPMLEKVDEALKNTTYEVVFVDDGSTDGSAELLLSLNQPHIQVLLFTRNYGQTSAIAAGIQAAKGEYIVTMDGDMQNDPLDIPLMMDVLQKSNVDVVAGIRAKRKDGMIFRKLPSLIANYCIRVLTKVRMKDYGCTLKLFKASVAKQLDLYGELHRFIPVLVQMHGAKMAQFNVRHHPRQFGVSKYGLGRTFRVVSDLVFMVFMQRYRQKPMHFFGTVGFVTTGLGFLIEFYLLCLKLMGQSIGQRPLFYVGFMLVIVGLQLVTTGFMAELIMRTYYESQGKRPYSIHTHKIGKTIISEKNLNEA